jgi:hypothetical protein
MPANQTRPMPARVRARAATLTRAAAVSRRTTAARGRSATAPAVLWRGVGSSPRRRRTARRSRVIRPGPKPASEASRRSLTSALSAGRRRGLPAAPRHGRRETGRRAPRPDARTAVTSCRGAAAAISARRAPLHRLFPS